MSKQFSHDPEIGSITTIPFKKDPLSFRIKFFYSLGHIMNDLSCAMWFSYTLLYFKYTFSGSKIGLIILLGQISDAVFSPLIGYMADRDNNCFLVRSLGKRKFWYVLGTVLSSITVPLFYNKCLFGDNTNTNVQFVYYAILAIVWQGSWASIQVSHVSLINYLTTETHERIALNSYR